MNTRIRTVRDQEHVDRLVDDFIIMGYTISEQKEKSVKLIDKKYGSIGTHILIFIFFFWTYGIINVLWLIYNYYDKSQEVFIKIEESLPK